MTFFYISASIGNGRGNFGFTVFGVGFDIAVDKHGPELIWWFHSAKGKMYSWSWENGYETF